MYVRVLLLESLRGLCDIAALAVVVAWCFVLDIATVHCGELVGRAIVATWSSFGFLRIRPDCPSNCREFAMH